MALRTIRGGSACLSPANFGLTSSKSKSFPKGNVERLFLHQSQFQTSHLCSSRVSLGSSAPRFRADRCQSRSSEAFLAKFRVSFGLITKILGLQSLSGPPYSGSRQHYGYLSGCAG